MNNFKLLLFAWLPNHPFKKDPGLGYLQFAIYPGYMKNRVSAELLEPRDRLKELKQYTVRTIRQFAANEDTERDTEQRV